jgi:hypothetical protein
MVVLRALDEEALTLQPLEREAARHDVAEQRASRLAGPGADQGVERLEGVRFPGSILHRIPWARLGLACETRSVPPPQRHYVRVHIVYTHPYGEERFGAGVPAQPEPIAQRRRRSSRSRAGAPPRQAGRRARPGQANARTRTGDPFIMSAFQGVLCVIRCPSVSHGIPAKQPLSGICRRIAPDTL